MKISKLTVASLLFAAAAIQPALADQTYTVAPGSVSANASDPGLVIQDSIDGSLSGMTFTLPDGGSDTFNFFKIWTNETSVNPDDTAQESITATLDFSDPAINAAIDGVTFGGTLFFGVGQWGQVEWTTPAPTFSVDGVTFQVTLSDATFNAGLFGLDGGQRHGANITATVTQISSSVPDATSAGLLLGISLMGLGFVARRSRRTA